MRGAWRKASTCCSLAHGPLDHLHRPAFAGVLWPRVGPLLPLCFYAVVCCIAVSNACASLTTLVCEALPRAALSTCPHPPSQASHGLVYGPCSSPCFYVIASVTSSLVHSWGHGLRKAILCCIGLLDGVSGVRGACSSLRHGVQFSSLSDRVGGQQQIASYSEAVIHGCCLFFLASLPRCGPALRRSLRLSIGLGTDHLQEWATSHAWGAPRCSLFSGHVKTQ